MSDRWTFGIHFGSDEILAKSIFSHLPDRKFTSEYGVGSARFSKLPVRPQFPSPVSDAGMDRYRTSQQRPPCWQQYARLFVTSSFDLRSVPFTFSRGSSGPK
jgi:hypothetical protein